MFLNIFSFDCVSILLDTVFVNGLEAIYLTSAYAVLYVGFVAPINLPVDIFTGIFKLIFPATSLLLIFTIPWPVSTTLFILDFIP